jgi:hypothetical protein
MRHAALRSLAVALIAIQAAGSMAQSGPSFVVPSGAEGNEPFTFGLPQFVEGEVVQIQTVEGEVVARVKPNREGLAYLPAGLAAGTYLLSSSGGVRKRTPGKLVIQPISERLPNDLPFRVANPPQAFNLQDGLRLTGTGWSPNAADMELDHAGTQLPILAASRREVLTGPLPKSVSTGSGPLRLSNLATGEGVIVNDVFAYRMTSHLVKRTLVSGEQTVLEFRMEPNDAQANVRAQVHSGPVRFAGGASEASCLVQNGTGTLPLFSQVGETGPFQLTWMADGAIYRDPQQQKEDERKKKHLERAEQAEKEAEKHEKEAEKAEEKGNHKKAAEERGKAAAKRREAAGDRRAAGDNKGAADQERKAADNSRSQAEAHDRAGGNQRPGKDARRDAAASERRAAGDEQRQALEDAKTDKGKAADAMDRAADGYERAAGDYRANGEASEASRMDKAAEGARGAAERLRK